MNNSTKKLLFWSPRIICMLFALFISIFALDVFGEGQGFWQTVLALIMHLIPTFIVILFLIIAWRREWIGAILFAILAVLYVVWAWGRFPLLTYVIMTTPMWIMAILFAVNWHYRSVLHAGSN